MTAGASRHGPGTLGRAVDEGAARLAAAGVDTPRLDARVLAAHYLGRDPSFVLTRPEMELSDHDREAIARLVGRRAAREPISRILGEREFWSLTFTVTDATLSPRPDTETLVEAVTARIRESGRENEALAVLDLGTGTGCLLLALLSELPRARGLGVDISAEAVTTARANAQGLGFRGRATFQTGDWGTGLEGPFDIVVSNPPYVAEHDRDDLPPEVRDFDPAEALYAGPDGLAAYAAMAPQAAALLAPEGLVCVELGQGQEAAVVELFAGAGLSHRGSWADLQGIPRAALFEAAI